MVGTLIMGAGAIFHGAAKARIIKISTSIYTEKESSRAEESNAKKQIKLA